MLISKGKIRAASEHFSLTLHVWHRFAAVDDDEPIPTFIARLPPDTAVYAAQGITMHLSGFLNKARIPAQHLASSQLVRHLCDYLETNADDLALEAVGKPCLDGPQDALLCQVPITPQFTSRNPQTRIPHLTLCGIDLRFSWQTDLHKETINEDDPFAAYCPLPYLAILNEAISRFATSQLARRYPLIFGPWCKQLAAERSSIESIEKSINRIIKRSTDDLSQKRYHSLFRTLKQQGRRRIECATDSLSKYIPITPQESICLDDAFFMAMEDIYKRALRKPMFKGISRVSRDKNQLEAHFFQNDLGSENEFPNVAGRSSPIDDDIFADSISLDGDPVSLELDLLGFKVSKVSCASDLLGEDLLEHEDITDGQSSAHSPKSWMTEFETFSDFEETEVFRAEDYSLANDGGLSLLGWNSRSCSPHNSFIWNDEEVGFGLRDAEDFLLDEEYAYDDADKDLV